MPGGPELGQSLSVERILCVIGGDLFEQGLVFLAFFPDSREFLGRAGNTIFESWCDDALGRIGQGGQKVACGLARSTQEAAAGPELFGGASGTKVDLPALV